MSFYSHSVPTLAPEERDRPLGPRVWAGAILMFASVGFFLLAGCFTVGILVVLNPSTGSGTPAQAPDLSSSEFTFLIVLYALAGVCVLAGVSLFFVGLIGLLRILYGRAHPD